MLLIRYPKALINRLLKALRMSSRSLVQGIWMNWAQKVIYLAMTVLILKDQSMMRVRTVLPITLRMIVSQ